MDQFSGSSASPTALGRLERRKNRSSCTATALELALGSSAKRANLDVLLVVDDDGLLVSNSPSAFDLALLAAVTPIVGRGRAKPRIRRGGAQRDMTVRALDFEGDRLYVAAVGGESEDRLRELRISVAAARRILAA